ncbi:unnamed protein product [Nesidiocoris tenuis]|uniref:Uncharacterized protein n=1 Tax=Nesidiocoris tenuis TaxID=355587 RepID=A0A6H5HGU4_9HEMI|nr:unnamed protein product [Nesidiocoris tenuis]
MEGKNVAPTLSLPEQVSVNPSIRLSPSRLLSKPRARGAYSARNVGRIAIVSKSSESALSPPLSSEIRSKEPTMMWTTEFANRSQYRIVPTVPVMFFPLPSFSTSRRSAE